VLIGMFTRKGIRPGIVAQRPFGSLSLADHVRLRRDGNPPIIGVHLPRIANTRQDHGCAIKGDRNRCGEWIYHLPGMLYYDATRAKEMFCSEAQARTAGYRRAIVRRQPRIAGGSRCSKCSLEQFGGSQVFR
jgi:hypothetical protein